MMNSKRYHPCTMLFDSWNYVKSMFLPAIFLFVINLQSQSFIYIYGRYTFYGVTAIAIIYIVLKWLTRKYVLGDTAFHLYKGLFNKSEQTIPYLRIQNVNRQTTVFHRVFNMTSLHFETAMTGESATVKFDVLSRKEAKQITAFIDKEATEQTLMEADEKQPFTNQHVKDAETKPDKMIHFNPSKHDLFKASFTSLSFLVLIPIILSLYTKLDDFLDIENKAEGIVATILNSWWILAIGITIFIIASVLFGMIRIYLKYGKYEISSDMNRIYITQGTVNETAFSISKENIQAIEINQSFIKKILHLVEVKLISAGKLELDDDKVEINSLYPYLPEGKAYKILNEMLPDYEIDDSWLSLSQKVFWLRLLRSSWFFILSVIGLTYFKPTIYGVSQAWWIMIVFLLMMMVTTIFFNVKNTKFILNHQFIQIRKGGFTTTQLITKRKKIIEVKVSRSMFQRKLNIASIEIVNRANPVLHTSLSDVSTEMASTFYTWYMDRTKEIEIK